MLGKIVATLGVLVGLALISHAQEIGYPQITVNVTATAQISAKQLTAAETRAARVFEQAGLGIHWLNCFKNSLDSPSAPACDHPLSPADFVLQILPSSRNATNSTFGVSFLDASGGVYADIFLDRVQSLRELDPKISFSGLLGSVIAHELGHLLLGEHSHSRTGLMRAHWQAEELGKIAKGNLWFDSKQAVQLRERATVLNARVHLSRATA